MAANVVWLKASHGDPSISFFISESYCIALRREMTQVCELNKDTGGRYIGQMVD